MFLKLLPGPSASGGERFNCLGRSCGVVGQVEGAAVIPVIAKLGVESNELDLLGQRGSRELQDIIELLRKGEQGRPNVEGETFSFAYRKFSAEHGVSFEELHRVAGDSQANRSA